MPVETLKPVPQPEVLPVRVPTEKERVVSVVAYQIYRYQKVRVKVEDLLTDLELASSSSICIGQEVLT